MSIKEYLEKAYVSAMYEGMHVTAGLIAAALETTGVLDEHPSGNSSEDMENVVSFPCSSQK